MSTNDMVLLLANGASNVKLSHKERKVLQEVISWVMESLAEQIAADGEGARKLIIVRTVGFKTKEDARTVARAVSNSPLVKTAIAGSDANWGRILSAAGYWAWRSIRRISTSSCSACRFASTGSRLR